MIPASCALVRRKFPTDCSRALVGQKARASSHAKVCIRPLIFIFTFISIFTCIFTFYLYLDINKIVISIIMIFTFVFIFVFSSRLRIDLSRHLHAITYLRVYPLCLPLS